MCVGGGGGGGVGGFLRGEGELTDCGEEGGEGGGGESRVMRWWG